jgi:predicted secreted protein
MQVDVEGIAKPTIVAAVEPAQARIKPIKWWAGLGIGYLCLAFYVMVRWLTSDQVGAIPKGSDPIPDYARWALIFWDVVSPIMSFVVVYLWGIRPWRREGHITTDGVLIIAIMFSNFLDPLYNYTQYQFSYNSHHLNFGTWLGKIPGVLVPNARLHPEPIAWGFSYIWSFFLAAWFSCILMRSLKRRWPHLGNVGLLGIVFAFWTVVDGVLEPTLFMRLSENWAYPGAVRWLTLFAGSRYQFPIYEAVFSGVMLTGVAALRYFVDDKGRTIVDRGIDEIRASAGQKTMLRIFATTGCVVTIIFGGFFLPFQWFGAHADSWPKDMPSYFLNGICGEGTPYPCPESDVPIFRPGSTPPILPPAAGTGP